MTSFPKATIAGLYFAKLKCGTVKLIHLRNVASITYKKTSITFYYNFPCVTGENYYERVDSKPAYDTLEWGTEAEAEKEFERCTKAFEELQ